MSLPLESDAVIAVRPYFSSPTTKSFRRPVRVLVFLSVHLKARHLIAPHIFCLCKAFLGNVSGGVSGVNGAPGDFPSAANLLSLRLPGKIFRAEAESYPNCLLRSLL